MRRIMNLAVPTLSVLLLMSGCNKVDDVPGGDPDGRKIDIVEESEITFSVIDTFATKAIVPVTVLDEFNVTATTGASDNEADVENFTNVKFEDPKHSSYRNSEGKFWPVADPGYHFYASNASMNSTDSGQVVRIESIGEDIVCAYLESSSYKARNSLTFDHILARVGRISFSNLGRCTDVSLSMKYVGAGTYNLRTKRWSALGAESTKTLSASDNDFWIVPGTYDLTLSYTDPSGATVTKAARQEFAAGTVNNVTASVTWDLSRIDFLTGAEMAQETANCYVVRAQGEYKFPLVYGNGISGGEVNPSAYTNGSTSTMKAFCDNSGNNITSPYILTQKNLTEKNVTVSVHWQSKSGMISNVSVKDGYIYFKANSLDGNAQIVVKSGTNILWSWHIWATSLALSQNQGILSHNVGAVSGDIKGCYYQWGRKDPFVSGQFSTTTSAVPNMKGTIATPKKYILKDQYCTTEYRNNWDADNDANSTDSPVVKTIYDPCPAGFTVPRYSAFQSCTSSNGGAWSSGYKWFGFKFPTTGNINPTDGTIVDTNVAGFCWLSVPSSGVQANYHRYAKGDVTSQTSSRRGLGLPVRPAAKVGGDVVTYELVMTGSAVSVQAGSTVAIVPKVMYYKVTGGVRDAGTDVTSSAAFASANTAVATISGKTVTGVAAGSTSIYATYNGLSTSGSSGIDVTVTGGEVTETGREYYEPVVTLSYRNDVGADGSRTDFPKITYSQKALVTYSDGSIVEITVVPAGTDAGILGDDVATFSGTARNSSSATISKSIGYVTGKNRGTDAYTRGVVFEATATVTVNGKSGFATVNVYQETNRIEEYGSWSYTGKTETDVYRNLEVGISASPATISAAGGTSTLSYSATYQKAVETGWTGRSRTVTYTSGSTKTETDSTPGSSTGEYQNMAGTPTIIGSAEGFSLSGKTVTAAKNTGTDDRFVTYTASFSIGDLSDSDDVTITQKAPGVDYTFSVSQNSLSWGATEYGSGKGKSFTVTTNGTWEISSQSVNDFTVSTSGNTITVYPKSENTTTSARTGSITVRCKEDNSKTATVTLRQEAGTVTYKIIVEGADITLAKGESTTFSPTVKYVKVTNGNEGTPTAVTSGITYYSGDTGIATVVSSTKRVTASSTGTGSTKIYAKVAISGVDYDSKDNSSGINVTVKAPDSYEIVVE